MSLTSREEDFEVSKKLAQSMLNVVTKAENVGQGVDAISLLLAVYLGRLRDTSSITPNDAVVLALASHQDVLRQLSDQPLPNSSAVH
jgi:predicted nucleic acid-binding protein